MGKSQPEKYNPGDLDRTRNNLGELSREEAERMSSILGGEIGIERTDEALQQKYDILKKTTSAKGSSGRGSGRPAGPGGSGSSQNRAPGTQKKAGDHSSAYSGHYTRKIQPAKKLGYLERIRIDKMAARPEHRVKTRADVVSAYFSFLLKRKDTVNPEFIVEGEQFYYGHIEALVSDLKALLKLVSPAVFKLYINPYYRDLIKVLISWDLETMNICLSDLQKSPRNRDIRDCGKLCSAIYGPIMSVSHIDINHLYAAVNRLYKVLLILHSEEPEELITIKNKYLDIKDKIKIVFKDIAFTCYPLLLKLIGSKFFYYREFINRERGKILAFLNIEERSLLTPPEDLNELGKKQYSLKHLREKIKKEREEELARLGGEEKSRDKGEIQKSLQLLESLFPESGWAKQAEFPDFYPYFQPLFKFPKGTELISREDPLQQVVVLAAIIQDLLYGFRSIVISSQFREPLEKITDKWHLFIDEMVQTNYNNLLIEYCRNIEKGNDFSGNKFGQKLLTDLYWLKRRFILPHLKFKVLYKSESVPLKAPKLHEQTAKFYEALNGLMEEFDGSDSRQSVIENYNEAFHFEIKNVTSSRLKKILTQDNITPTNENLLRYTLMLVSLLDFLLSSKASPYYQKNTDEIPLYRYDPVYQGKPLYSVMLKDTAAILKKY